MANRPWLDEVLSRLVRRGLPPSYIRRFAEELSDHLEDLKENAMSREADVCSQLGKPDQVADAAVAAYRHRRFLVRHPTAALLLLAASSLTSLMVLITLSLAVVRIAVPKEVFGCINGDGTYTIPRPVALALLPHLMTLLTVVIPLVFATVFCCKLAWHIGLGAKRTLAVCILMALIAAVPSFGVDLTGLAGYKGIHFTLWMPGLCGVSRIHFVHFAQLLIPLAIGWRLMRRAVDQGEMQLAPSE